MASNRLIRAALFAVAAAAVLSPLAIASAGEGIGGLVAGIAEHLLGTICHQLPQRSLWFDGQPLALCARCWSLWLAGAAGLGLGLFGRVPRPERLLLTLSVAMVPMLVDVALNFSGFGGADNFLRMLISAPAGLVAGLIAGFGIDEILRKHEMEDPCPSLI